MWFRKRDSTLEKGVFLMSVFTIVKAPQELPAKHKKRPEKPLSFFEKECKNVSIHDNTTKR